MANAQDLLSVTRTTGASLDELIEALVRMEAPDPSRRRVSGAPLNLPPDATTPFALILYELAANALKYTYRIRRPCRYQSHYRIGPAASGRERMVGPDVL